MPARTTITCTSCSATAPVPEDGDFSPLWQAGWRWLGSWELFSCPPCPPVVVERDGLHVKGPATLRP